MPEGRWRVPLGPVLIALASLLLVGSASLDAMGATGGGGPRPPVVSGCAQPSGDRQAAWYQLDERSDPRGALVGYTMTLGLLGSDRPEWSRLLSPESHAAGPFGGVVLYGSDDGVRSEVRLVVARTGCEAVIAREDRVVRRATIDPAGLFVYYHAVDRATRADLGIWRRRLGHEADAAQVMPPLERVAEEPTTTSLGRVFSTELAWSTDGRDLAVQACGAASCEARVLDASTLAVTRYAGAGQGGILGLTRDLVVSYEACAGFPCPIVGIERPSGRLRTLAGAASGARLAPDRGGILLYEPPTSAGYEIVALDLASGARRTLYRAPTDRLRLLPGQSRSLAGADTRRGWVTLTPSERFRAARVAPRLLRLSDGTTAPMTGGSR